MHQKQPPAKTAVRIVPGEELCARAMRDSHCERYADESQKKNSIHLSRLDTLLVKAL